MLLLNNNYFILLQHGIPIPKSIQDCKYIQNIIYILPTYKILKLLELMDP